MVPNSRFRMSLFAPFRKGLPGRLASGEQKPCQSSAAPGAAPRSWPTEQGKFRGFQNRRQNQSCSKSADMGPPGHARLMGIAEPGAHQLQHEPETHHPNGAERHRIEDDAEWND